MAVKIYKIGEDEENGLPVYAAEDLATGEEVPCKNWFEKSKNKWHIVLGPNSANRKYIAHNEFNANAKDEDGAMTYVVEDKTTGPRVMGTAQPDRWAVPFMTAEEKETYDGIIARAMERREAERAAAKAAPLTEEEKLQRKIAALEAKLKKLEAEKTDEEVEG